MIAPSFAEVRIVDGDTLAIDGQRVRLFGIDAPERGQPGAAESTEHLRKLIGRARPNCAQIDFDRRSNRPVSICIANELNLSIEMLRAGQAVVWCSFIAKPQPGLLPTFKSAEAEVESGEARDMGEAAQSVAGVGLLARKQTGARSS